MHLWHIINILNTVLDTETSFNLSFISEEHEDIYPMKTRVYSVDNSDILKEENVIRVEKHEVSDCECYKYAKYQKISLVDLLNRAESENRK